MHDRILLNSPRGHSNSKTHNGFTTGDRRLLRCTCQYRTSGFTTHEAGCARIRRGFALRFSQGWGCSREAQNSLRLDGDKKKRILLLAPAGAREEKMSANWKTVKEDLDWSLNQGDDVKGRAELKEAFSNGGPSPMSSIIDAYKMGQRDNHKLANLSRCLHEDEKRLYKMGQKLIEPKPM